MTTEQTSPDFKQTGTFPAELTYIDPAGREFRQWRKQANLNERLQSDHDDVSEFPWACQKPATGMTYKRIAKKWKMLPASTKRCQMAW